MWYAVEIGSEQSIQNGEVKEFSNLFELLSWAETKKVRRECSGFKQIYSATPNRVKHGYQLLSVFHALNTDNPLLCFPEITLIYVWIKS